jgi:hypothetical protein
MTAFLGFDSVLWELRTTKETFPVIGRARWPALRIHKANAKINAAPTIVSAGYSLKGKVDFKGRQRDDIRYDPDQT